MSANAGSGKTHVLVQRVIRLLLSGVPPEKILCITFTKAAAANMAERVFTTLGHWVTLDDDALDDAIREAGIAHPTPACARRRANCSPRALETPGGLKVQTIHALCTRLLQQFPFEANVPARFAVLDDRDQNEMMERANLAVLLDASRDPDSADRARAQYRDGERRRRHLQGRRARSLPQPRPFHGLDRCGRQRRCCGGRRCRRRLASTAGDRIEDIEREIVDGPHTCRDRGWSEIARRSRRQQQVRPGPGGTAARGAGFGRRGSGR